MDDTAFEVLLEKRHPPGRQTQPTFWNDEAFNNLTQPVVGIGWYETYAYCTWLVTQTGQSFHLPIEAEWETAARGPTRRRYAYGDVFDAIWSNASKRISQTTPVSVFPGSATPEGLIEMAGNAWDWTSSGYQPYPHDAANGREGPAGDAHRFCAAVPGTSTGSSRAPPPAIATCPSIATSTSVFGWLGHPSLRHPILIAA